MIRTTFRAGLVALALSGVSTGAFAQTAAPEAPTAPAQTQFSESHLALAREVVISSGMSRSFEAVIPQMEEGLLRQFGRNPALVDDAVEVVRSLRPEMELQRQVMVNRAARVIAGRLSEAELQAIATFFESEAGKRYVEVQPAMLDGLISEMQVWSQELTEYLQIRASAEMAERRAAAAGGTPTPSAPQ